MNKYIGQLCYVDEETGDVYDYEHGEICHKDGTHEPIPLIDWDTNE